MDLKFTDDLDLATDGEHYLFTETEEEDRANAVLVGLFTDERVTRTEWHLGKAHDDIGKETWHEHIVGGDYRGYWAPLLCSKLWIHEQMRITEKDMYVLEKDMKEFADKVVAEGIYFQMDVNVGIVNGAIHLQFIGYPTPKHVQENNPTFTKRLVFTGGGMRY